MAKRTTTPLQKPAKAKAAKVRAPAAKAAPAKAVKPVRCRDTGGKFSQCPLPSSQGKRGASGRLSSPYTVTGWVAKSEYVGPLPSELLRDGWKLVGTGKVPSGGSLLLAWTGSRRAGFRGTREKWYVGRWVLA